LHGHRPEVLLTVFVAIAIWKKQGDIEVAETLPALHKCPYSGATLLVALLGDFDLLDSVHTHPGATP